MISEEVANGYSRKKSGRIEPGQLSAGHIALSELGENDIKEVSGVNADLQGHLSERQESGRAMMLRHKQGMLVSEILFDNFRYSMQIFGQTMLEFIRKTNLYSEQEIRQVLDDSTQNININQLQDFAIGRYGLKLDQRPSSPTVRMANYLELLEAYKIFPQIDPKFLIQVSDMPNKEAIIEDIRDKQEQAMLMSAVGVKR